MTHQWNLIKSRAASFVVVLVMIGTVSGCKKRNEEPGTIRIPQAPATSSDATAAVNEKSPTIISACAATATDVAIDPDSSASYRPKADVKAIAYPGSSGQTIVVLDTETISSDRVVIRFFASGANPAAGVYAAVDTQSGAADTMQAIFTRTVKALNITSTINFSGKINLSEAPSADSNLLAFDFDLSNSGGETLRGRVLACYANSSGK